MGYASVKLTTNTLKSGVMLRRTLQNHNQIQADGQV